MYVPTKTCYRCAKTKPVADFYRRSGPKSQYRNICKTCQDAACRVYRTTPEAREKGRDKARLRRSDPANVAYDAELRRKRNQLSPRTAIRLMIFNASKRANVSVSLDQLFSLWKSQNGCCAITGIRMTWSQGQIKATSLSLDRINQDRDYCIGNVRFVCHAINCFRGRMTDAEMVEMARTIVERADADLITSEAA